MLAAIAIWGYSAELGNRASGVALQYVDPIWSNVTNVINATENLVDTFVGLTGAIPIPNLQALGHRRLQEIDAATANIDAMLQANKRELQQLPSLDQLASGLAQIGQSVAATVAPALEQAFSQGAAGNLFVNGTQSPLYSAMTGLSQSAFGVLNSTGCPVYCVDLRGNSWVQGNQCICNLDRVKSGSPYLPGVITNLLPAAITLVLMYVGATWLLLHGAAQWARTRTEAKLLHRVPAAATMPGQHGHATAATAPKAANGSHLV